MNKALFLDRDGVINEDDKKYLYKIEDFHFCKGIFEVISFFQKNGYLIFVVTNQSGIERGYYSEKEFLKVTNYMLDRLKRKNLQIKEVYYCPHHPDTNCNCRKPNNQMFEDAIKKYNIDVQSSWIIGDRDTDIIAAKKSGILNSILIKSGKYTHNEEVTFSVKNTFEIVKLINEGKIIL